VIPCGIEQTHLPQGGAHTNTYTQLYGSSHFNLLWGSKYRTYFWLRLTVSLVHLLSSTVQTWAQ
jgi:hypothetical protein